MSSDTIEPNVAAYTFKKLLRMLHTMQKHASRTLPAEPDIVRANATLLLGMIEHAIETIEADTPWTVATAEAANAPNF